jgi:small subunit ribosomal protein S11
MSEEQKNNLTEEQVEKPVEKKTPKPRAKKKADTEETIEEVKNDNPLGLEELPEEIKKKLEKKESQQKSAKKGKIVKKKKKVAKKVTVGNAYIKATYNNTIVTLTDLSGNVLSWASAGVAGFKGAKKSTPYAGQIISRIAVGKAREEYGLEDVNVYVSGVGTGRESAIRSLNNNGLNVMYIKDVTAVPHNGCRQRKPRRV